MDEFLSYMNNLQVGISIFDDKQLCMKNTLFESLFNSSSPDFSNFMDTPFLKLHMVETI